MTVEERAQKTIDKVGNRFALGDHMRKEMMQAITQALRDQIEDCAKIAKTHHDCGHEDCISSQPFIEIAERIRDMANQTENKEVGR